jgi:hypothetical protein
MTRASETGAMNFEFLCQYLGHRRYRDMIQFNGAEKRWESVCKRCGVRMVRTRDGWKLEEPKAEEAPAD